jgi:hypothetical protein
LYFHGHELSNTLNAFLALLTYGDETQRSQFSLYNPMRYTARETERDVCKLQHKAYIEILYFRQSKRIDLMPQEI